MLAERRKGKKGEKVLRDMKSCICIIALICFSVILVAGKGYTQESADLAYQKGASYLKQNKLDEAIGEFSKAIEINPRSDKAYYDRGRAYDAKGELDKAIEDYTNAIEINWLETIQAAYNNRTLVYEKKGELDKALADYTKGIEAVPNPTFSGFKYFKSALHRNRAEIYRIRGEFDKALEDVRAIENLGGEAGPDFIAKLKNKDSSTNLSPVLKEKAEKYPGADSEVNLYNSRGYQSFEKGQYDLAIADYNRALAIDPNDAMVLANRANAYAAKGNLDQAISDYTKAVEINPKDWSVYHDLGLTYINKGEFDKAIYHFNKALEVNPGIINDGQFHNDRAVAYFWEKEYDKCWEDVNKAIDLGYRVHPEFLRELKKATGQEK